MTVYFIDRIYGLDLHDGLDNIGVGLATATWEEATLTLTQNGHGYTFAAGDVIYLASGTGLTPGLYEVASSTANTITLVETSTLPTVGNGSDVAAGDDGTGDWTSSDGPFKSIQQSMDTVAAGDWTWVRNTGNYGEVVSAIQAGTNTDPIWIVGYGTSVGDSGVATNDGTDSLSLGLNPAAYYIIKNMRFTQFISNGIGSSVAETADVCVFINVRCDNNGNDGISVDDNCNFYGCYFHNNNGSGVECDNNGIFTNCIFADNGVDGLETNYGVVINCLFISNGANAIDFLSAAALTVVNCTIDGDNKDTSTGIRFAQAFQTRITCVNNIIYDCTTGIAASADSDERRISMNNLVNNCTTPYSNFGTDEGEQLGAPVFVNEGTDYTPADGSPAKNAGADLSTLPWGLTHTGQQKVIGAIAHIDPGSGGGLLSPNKRAGKQ